jgi:2-keto-4-pentenoate hydratase/2-oxohepta-3-ene-1,7-dioic acid hydratase in catechol pathway
VEHAPDLLERAPTAASASFTKPDTTIIGFGDRIEIPQQSDRTTAEAELRIVIGKRCKEVEEDRPEWLQAAQQSSM